LISSSFTPRRSLFRRAGYCFIAGAALLVAIAEARATVAPYMGLEDLERGSEAIVVGSVETADSGWSEDGRLIVTRITVKVDRAMKGGPRQTVTFEVPGGTIDGQTLVASGAPVFHKGERVVLFLDRGGAAEERLGVVGWNQGRFAIERDPQTHRDLVRQPGGGTLYVDAQGRPAHRDPQLAGPRELADFLSEIEGLVAKGAAARGQGRP
jgi:hypothetical protein